MIAEVVIHQVCHSSVSAVSYVESLAERGVASIFKRNSEPLATQKFGGLADFSQTYKKYTVQRKIAIGRHERVLAIDGDYIHVRPPPTQHQPSHTSKAEFVLIRDADPPIRI